MPKQAFVRNALGVLVSHLALVGCFAAPVNWLQIGTGFWDDPVNWSGGVLPGNQDSAMIDFGTVSAATIRQLPSAPTSAFTRYAVASLIARSPVNMVGGALLVSGDATFEQAFTWSGGALQLDPAAPSSSWTFRQGIDLTAGALVGMNGGRLELQGHSVLGGARGILVGSASPAHLASGASLDIRSGDLLKFNSAFTIDGSIERSAGTGLFELSFGGGGNQGSVRNRTGVLLFRNGDLSSPALQSGSFTVDAGAELRFANAQTFTGTISGAGDVRLTNFADFSFSAPAFALGGALHLDGGAKALWQGDGTIGNLQFGSGTFKPQGQVDVTQKVHTTGAAFLSGAASSRTRFLDGVDFSNSLVITSGALDLGGTTVMAGANSIGVSGPATLTVLPTATLRLTNDAGAGGIGAILGGGHLVNQGLIQRDTGLGSFVIGANVSNQGRLALRSGQLAMLSDFTQTNGGVFDVALGALTVPLSVLGLARLGGTLELSFAPGFVPLLGQSFELLTYADHLGSFVLLPTGEAARTGYNYGLNYGASALTLEVTHVAAAVPEPQTWALMLVGLGAIGWHRRRTQPSGERKA